MSETTQSISVVQQSLQKLSTENTNLKREVEDLQKRQSPEERIRQLEKEVDELRKNNKDEIDKLREEVVRVQDQGGKPAPSPAQKPSAGGWVSAAPVEAQR